LSHCVRGIKPRAGPPQTPSWLAVSKRRFEQCGRCSGTGIEENIDKYVVAQDVSKFRSALKPWSVGSWIVWDCISEINATSHVAATESTPVLFAGKDGYAFRLVVELLPGPSGLVTPHWWKLGLTAFPDDKPNEDFVAAIHQVMEKAADRNRSFRVRWYLDEVNDPYAWTQPLNGRSGQAAAACAVLAAFEKLSDKRAGDRAKRAAIPVLDRNAAVSAEVKVDSADRLENAALGAVEPSTLPSKFDAAVRAGIELLCLTQGQPLGNAVRPKGLRLEHAATVGAALDVLRAVHRAIERFKEKTRKVWTDNWLDVEPPGQG
jgi:hypothetical protein